MKLGSFGLYAAEGLTAEPQCMYAGNLVSDQATYTSRMSADSGLTARFAATPGSTPASALGNGVGSNSNGSTAKTGDAGAPWALALLATLVAAGGIAVESRRRIARS